MIGENENEDFKREERMEVTRPVVCGWCGGPEANLRAYIGRFIKLY